MAKYIEEKIGAMSQKNWHGLKYKNPLKNYRVHEMPTGNQLPPHYIPRSLLFIGSRDHRMIAIRGFAPSLGLPRTGNIAPRKKGTEPRLVLHPESRPFQGNSTEMFVGVHPYTF